MNCVCQNGPQRPGLQEVLDTLQRSTVCTGTQCFETEAEAFGLQAPPSNAQDSSTAFVMLMMYAPPACAALSALPCPSPSRTAAPLAAGAGAALRRGGAAWPEAPARLAPLAIHPPRSVAGSPPPSTRKLTPPLPGRDNSTAQVHDARRRNDEDEEARARDHREAWQLGEPCERAPSAAPRGVSHECSSWRAGTLPSGGLRPLVYLSARRLCPS